MRHDQIYWPSTHQIMKMTQLLLSGIAGLALTLVACNPKEQADGTAAPSGEMQTVSIKVSGMT
jgi:hypothetical protein